MDRPETDAAILAASVEDPDRFSELYERHLAVVVGYLAHRVGPELAEDLAAEAFVRAFHARDRYRAEHDSARPWLFGIAGNLIADNRRAERRRLRLIERMAGERDTSADPGHEAAVSGTDLSVALAHELRRLPASDRDALLLTVWGELSYEEAAAALAVPVGTIRSRIHRARRRLAAAIGHPTGAGADPLSIPTTGGGAHL